ncbi:protein root UVB sensitive 4-like isoform X1 [Cornus florida]|uniref:protein root UVB sensitive 4-like isoform X1 n=1 Tax=Cornus florida TaxID=4283 RepID=UPI0028999695|nr:protein root UVB sensitive 4-like isoform X1 [Cornus florida]
MRQPISLQREISGNYLEYVKWKFFHRVFSSALQVLATQALFQAIGIGYSRSLPSAAALNWVLKDGLGRLSRCIYTASLASAFDTNLKVWLLFPQKSGPHIMVLLFTCSCCNWQSLATRCSVWTIILLCQKIFERTHVNGENDNCRRIEWKDMAEYVP